LSLVEAARLASLLVSDFDYTLPEELIAQHPPARRGDSRMLVVSRRNDAFTDDEFANLPKYLGPGDCLVLNRTRVFPARLQARRNQPSGAEVEVFLLRSASGDENTWNTLVRPAKRVRSGDTLLFESGLSADVLAVGQHGERTLRFHSLEPVSAVFERIGSVPLPPYIHRVPKEEDKERYQTVFARASGSVAAPTAGLHFTEAMLGACRESGVEIAFVTLHVGLGTFAPLRELELAKVQLHEEYFEIERAEALKMNNARRLLTVGTTSVRTVETAALRGGIAEMQGETNLFITPGFQFRATGALLTNFHLPQSSLLILVCAFASRDLILRAYRHAVAQRYRFFSYGDCMLIL
jgi:S-adenosylmethionine:tRNA ribosyltransferase-isomerase